VIVRSFFVNSANKLKDYINDRLANQANVNGASVSAHQTAAIKALINSGVAPAIAHERITGKKKVNKSDVPGWIRSMELTYSDLNKYRSFGFNGQNPITMSEIRQLEDEIGPLEWWEVEFLFLIDQLIQSHSAEMSEK